MPGERFIDVQGLRIRYLEQGSGPSVLLLHGASLGSSADVWAGNLSDLAAYGLRAIAFDQPGFGLSDDPPDHSVEFRKYFVAALMDALALEHVYLIGHSQSGRIAVELAFAEPARYAKIVVLGTGSLLPPLPGGNKSAEGDEGGMTEPTIAETRKLLEDNLYDHSLITPAAVQLRHRMSTGKNFNAFMRRKQAPRADSGKGTAPLWQRVAEMPVPLRLIYGNRDRGHAAERAAMAKQLYPALDLHLLDRCKHLIHWDAAAQFAALSGTFLTTPR